MICRIWTICLVEDKMNDARHSQRLLPEHAQSATGGDGVSHRLVVGKCFKHGGQISFSLQKIAEPSPVGNRRGGFGVDTVARLREPDKMFSDNAFPRISILPPAENLAGVERRGQVVIADGQECFHRIIFKSSSSSSSSSAVTIRGRGRRRGRGGHAHFRSWHAQRWTRWNTRSPILTSCSPRSVTEANSCAMRGGSAPGAGVVWFTGSCASHFQNQPSSSL